MRLKSEIWVKAYLRRAVVQGAMAVVIRHGDDDAGAIFIKIVRGNRQVALYRPAPAGLDDSALDRQFVTATSDSFIAEDEADRILENEFSFDRDIWVIEIEDRDGRHFLGDVLLDSDHL